MSKNADVLIAWAQGKDVQSLRRSGSIWIDWEVSNPPSINDGCQWRIKPEVKADIICKARVQPGAFSIGITGGKPNLQVVFDGETGELKSAEVMK